MKKILVLLAMLGLIVACGDDSPTKSGGDNSSSSGTNGGSSSSDGGNGGGSSSSEPLPTIGIISMDVNFNASCTFGNPIQGQIKADADVSSISYEVMDSEGAAVSTNDAEIIAEQWSKFVIKKATASTPLTLIDVDGSPAAASDAYDVCIKMSSSTCLGTYQLKTTAIAGSETYEKITEFYYADGLSDEDDPSCPSWRATP